MMFDNEWLYFTIISLESNQNMKILIKFKEDVQYKKQADVDTTKTQVREHDFT